MKYPLAKPYITQREKDLVNDVLDSGFLSLGPKLEEFEKKFANKIGTAYACGVSSGTTGLHVMMNVAGITSGDEVITTPFSFIASSNCMLYVGAVPIFVDIDPRTYNIDPTKIEVAITAKTKAILVVHIFGQSADMDPIIDIAKRYNLILLEDACESICASYKGKNVGTFGQTSVFAFYPNKQMTTGEGGIICTDNKAIFDHAKSLTNQGRGANMSWLDHQYVGYNYRMDEMSAAVGIAQLEKLDWMIEERKKISDMYTKHLLDYSDLVDVPLTSQFNTNTWFVYVIQIKEKNKIRNKIIEKLRDCGISTKEYLPSIHLFHCYREKFGYNDGEFPISENVSMRSIALPFYIGLQESDIKYIIGKLVSAIKNI